MLGNGAAMCNFLLNHGQLSNLSWAPNLFVLGAQLAPGEKRLLCTTNIKTMSYQGQCDIMPHRRSYDISKFCVDWVCCSMLGGAFFYHILCTVFGCSQDLMKKVNKQCLLDTPRTVRVSEKTWHVIVRTRRP